VPQEAAIVSGLGVATAGLLLDASGSISRSTLKRLAKKAAGPLPAGGDEAAGWALLVVNGVYVVAFGTLASYVLPNVEALAPAALATPSGRLAQAAAAMLLPAAALAAHGRKFF
jgi:hypothetical protein